MIILNPVPIIPDQAPANKYNVPISLWLHDHNQLKLKLVIYKLNIIFVNCKCLSIKVIYFIDYILLK